MVICSEMVPYMKEFEDRGFDIEYLKTVRICSMLNLYIRLKMRLGMDVTDHIENNRRRLKSLVIKRCNEFQPDAILDSNGFYLDRETIEELKKHCYVFTKMIDRFVFFPNIYKIDRMLSYDRLFTYSKEDSELITKNGGISKYYPSVGDKYHYFDKKLPRDIDISFVGSMYPEKEYGYRFIQLKKLAKDFPKLKLYFAGKCAPIRKPKLFFKWLLNPRYRKAFINKNISREQCNDIYNRSKICLNFERNNTGNSWSGRIPSILRTNSFVLSYSQNPTGYSFEHYIDVFTNYDSLKDKISFYLSHPAEREKISKNGAYLIDEMERNIIGETMSDIVLSDIHILNPDRKGWNLEQTNK